MALPGVVPSTSTASQAAMRSGLASANEDTVLSGGMRLIPVGANDPYARTNEDQARAQAMVEAWQAYRGQLPDPLKVPRNQTNDNVKTNRCGPIVDKGVSWLFGKPVTVRVTPNSGTQTPSATGEGDTSADPRTARAQDWLDGCLKANRALMLLQKYATNGAVCGTPFLMLHPDRPLPNPMGSGDFPRLTLIDPATVTVQTAPDDVDLVECYVIEYRIVTGSATGWRRKVIERVDADQRQAVSGVETGEDDDYTADSDYGGDDTWRITDYSRAESSTFWTATGQTDWPYPFPPILHNQNLPSPNEFWGAPDLTRDLVELNRALNFVQSNIARILKYHAHPKTWVRGARGAEIDTSIDNIIAFQNPQAEIGNLEMKGDLASSMRFATDLRSSMDELSRVPGVAMGRLEDLPKGQVSGTTMRLLFEALTEKTESKRLLYGGMLEDLCMRLLWIAGFGQAVEVTLRWDDLLPVDDLLAGQAAVAYNQVGVPQVKIWEFLGFDPDELSDLQAAQQAQQARAAARGQALPAPQPPLGRPGMAPPGMQPGMTPPPTRALPVPATPPPTPPAPPKAPARTPTPLPTRTPRPTPTTTS